MSGDRENIYIRACGRGEEEKTALERASAAAAAPYRYDGRPLNGRCTLKKEEPRKMNVRTTGRKHIVWSVVLRIFRARERLIKQSVRRRISVAFFARSL